LYDTGEICDFLIADFRLGSGRGWFSIANRKLKIGIFSVAAV